MEPQKEFEIFYMVNARIPNERAHGIQIAHSSASMGGERVNLTLVTSSFLGTRPSLREAYGIPHPPRHIRIPALDIPHIPFRYVIRNATFFVSAFLYVLALWIKGRIQGRERAFYVRGELILFLIPLMSFIPIFFETHQIRNYEAWYKVALRRTCGIVVVTDGLKKKFVTEYGLPSEKILVARDAVDLESFNVTKRIDWSIYGIEEGKQIALYTGTLSEEKGVDTLALAGTYVSPGTHIVFLGGTTLQVRTFREKYGNRTNISILGRVDHTEVPAFIKSASVLVLPDRADFTYSNLYTSPMKLFEYMASGRPIVASRVPSLCEVLDDENAFFFVSGDAKALAECINEVLSDSVQGEKRAARARTCVESFTWDARGEAIVEHIRECMKHV